jgi:hypothetical protein
LKHKICSTGKTLARVAGHEPEEDWNMMQCFIGGALHACKLCDADTAKTAIRRDGRLFFRLRIKAALHSFVETYGTPTAPAVRRASNSRQLPMAALPVENGVSNATVPVAT